MKVGLLALAVSLSVLHACPALAQDTSVLTASSPWTLDYEDDSCALRRTFGSAEDQTTLEFRRFSPGSSLRTMVVSKRMNARSARFHYRFGREGEWQDAFSGATIKTDDGLSGVTFDSSLMPMFAVSDPKDVAALRASLETAEFLTEAERAATVDEITLRGAFREELTLKFGPLGAPIRGLSECMDDLLAQWGIDVEAHKTLSRPATPDNLTRVARVMDYPPGRMLESDQLNVRLAIDETGRITGCHVQMQLGEPAFAERTCASLEDLDFDPALDKDGKPIASYWITAVHFQAAH